MKKMYFYIILYCINSFIPMIDLYNKVKEYNIIISTFNNNKINNNIMLPLYSNFSLWICGLNISKYTNIFFYLNFASIIILCIIFFEKNKYENSKYITITKYFFISHVKIFLLSGFLSIIPLILNFITMSMFVSSIQPDSVYDIYYGIFSDNYFGDIFYQSQFLYLFIFIVLVFVFWGIIGCIIYSLTTILKNRIIPSICMCIIILIIHYIQYRSKSEKIFSPLSIFCSYRCLYENYIIIFIELIILLTILSCLYILKYSKLSLHKNTIKR